MKTVSQNSTRAIVILLITAAPFFINNSWKKAAKPTFKERIMEEATQGRKVAVFVNLGPISFQSNSLLAELCKIGEGITTSSSAGNMPSHTFTSGLEESIPSAYQQMSSIVTDELNKGMDVDVFESVEYGAVGKKTIKFLGIESEIPDWWTSDYKIIVELSPQVRYVTSQKSNPLTTRLTAMTLMYVREVVDGKEALGFIGIGKNFGSQQGAVVEHEACFTTLDDLKTNVSAPDALESQSIEGIMAPLAKFIQKENEKFDKAMKKKKKKS